MPKRVVRLFVILFTRQLPIILGVSTIATIVIKFVFGEAIEGMLERLLDVDITAYVMSNLYWLLPIGLFTGAVITARRIEQKEHINELEANIKLLLNLNEYWHYDDKDNCYVLNGALYVNSYRTIKNTSIKLEAL